MQRAASTHVSALHDSIARGHKLAKKEVALRTQREEEERLKREEIRARAERRKNYSKALGSPRGASPRRPLSPRSSNTCTSCLGRSVSPLPEARGDKKRLEEPVLEDEPGEAGKKRRNPAPTPHEQTAKKKAPQPRKPRPPIPPGGLALSDFARGADSSAPQSGRSSEELLAGIDEDSSFEAVEAACETEQAGTFLRSSDVPLFSGCDAQNAQQVRCAHSPHLASPTQAATSRKQLNGQTDEIKQQLNDEQRSRVSGVMIGATPALFERATFSESPRGATPLCQMSISPESLETAVTETGRLNLVPGHSSDGEDADVYESASMDSRFPSRTNEFDQKLPLQHIPRLPLNKMLATVAGRGKLHPSPRGQLHALAASAARSEAAAEARNEAANAERDAASVDRTSMAQKAVGSAKKHVGLFTRITGRFTSGMEGEAMEKGTSSVEPQQHSGRQRLEAMSEQLEAVITCMRLEQQARCAAEEELRQTRELLDEAQKEIQCMDASREAEKYQSTSLLALLVKLEAENRDLKETNSQLAQECRLLLVKDAR